MMPYVNDPETLLRAKEGDSQAMEQVVQSNLGLVKSIALRFAGRGVETEDLIQIGTVGMIKAIRGFDPQRECRFTTYAVPLIAGEIKRFFRDDGWIKISRDTKQNAARIFRLMQEYEKENGSPPPIEYLTESTGLSAEKIAVAISSARPALSLYEEDEETGFSPEKTVGEDPMEDVISRLALRESLESLAEEEKMLITLRYFKELTQEQTARFLGLTQVKVSREEKRILKKMRDHFFSDSSA